MLMIRLQRTGRKHEPTFRVVLTDSHNSTKSGRFIEVLGDYDPRKGEPTLQADRIREWMGKGAKLSGTVHNLLVTKGALDAKKVNVLPKKTVPKKDLPAQAGEPVAEAAAPAAAAAVAAEAAPEEVAEVPADTAEAPAEAAASTDAPSN